MLHSDIFDTVLHSQNFCLVVLLNPVCVLLSGMLQVFKSEVCVSVFQYVMTSQALVSVWRLNIVELFEPVFLKLWEARQKEAFHAITYFTLLHVLHVSRNSK